MSGSSARLVERAVLAERSELAGLTERSEPATFSGLTEPATLDDSSPEFPLARVCGPPCSDIIGMEPSVWDLAVE